MITTFFPPYNFGGDGIFVERLSQELLRRGHHVDVIHCADSYRFLAGSKPNGKYIKHPHLRIHALNSSIPLISPLLTHQMGRPVLKGNQIRGILDQDFDVIHYHNISLVGGPKILSYGNAVKIYTIHEYWLVCPTHTLFKFKRSACTLRSCLACVLFYSRPPQLWRYTKLLENEVRHVDVFITPDRYTPQKHCQMGLNLPTVYLPHFVPYVDRSRIDSVDHPSAQTKPYFFFAGRLERLKGLQNIIPIFRNYSKADFLIAGEGSFGRKLRKLAAGIKNVRFLGQLNHYQLQIMYRGAVALIVPSSNYEVAPPLVIMEAFSQKTPAIVREIGSMPKIIEDSSGGFVYRNRQELKKVMDQLLENPAKRDDLGLKGYQAIKGKWSVESHMNRYLDLIQRVKKEKDIRK